LGKCFAKSSLPASRLVIFHRFSTKIGVAGLPFYQSFTTKNGQIIIVNRKTELALILLKIIWKHLVSLFWVKMFSRIWSPCLPGLLADVNIIQSIVSQQNIWLDRSCDCCRERPDWH
jgi:hypothetical protein